MATVCKYIVYSGHVQGIGFRSTAKWFAKHYSIAGFVRNMPSGEVEVLAEGEDAMIETFLETVAKHMAGYIQETAIQDVEPQGLNDFRILTT